jgi:hypothetical protein
VLAPLFRGPDFAPLYFQLKTVTHERLLTSEGEKIPTVVAFWLSDTAKEEIDQIVDTDRRAALAILANDPHISMADLTTKLGFGPYHDGKPNKSKGPAAREDPHTQGMAGQGPQHYP